MQADQIFAAASTPIVAMEKLQGGTLPFVTGLGVGTRFTLRLPRAHVVASAA